MISQFDKINKQNQRSAIKNYVKQLNAQIEEIVLEMRHFLKPSKRELLMKNYNQFIYLKMNIINLKRFL